MLSPPTPLSGYREVFVCLILLLTLICSGAASAEQSVNAPPVAVGRLEAPDAAYRRIEPVVFIAEDSYDPDGQIVSYRWVWAGGSFEGARVEKTFPSGVFRFTLIVTDNEGASDSTQVNLVLRDEEQEPYISALLEAECAAAGQGLTVLPSGVTNTATDGAMVFPEEAPTDDPANIIRFDIPYLPYQSDFIPYFEISPADETIAPTLWVRVNGGSWVLNELYVPSKDFPGWGGYNIILDAGTSNAIEVAFTTEEDVIDQLYIELGELNGLERPRPSNTSGSNCPDFVNQPPVAKLDLPNREAIGQQFAILDASDSYDPDGSIIRYAYSITNYRGERAAPSVDVVIDEYGDVPIIVTVYDYYGASDSDTSYFRVVEPSPPSDRTNFRLQAECAATGEYWTKAEDEDAFGAALAIGGSAASYDSPPDDEPGNLLRFEIPNVSAADAGQYYLTGAFRSDMDEDNAIWVRINGGVWVKWDIYTLQQSYFPGAPFDLVEGPNVIELAYASPQLGVDALVLSPDTDFPGFDQTAADIVDVSCSNNGTTDTFWLEAECAEVGAAWTEVSSADAANGSYVVYPRGNSYGAPPADLPENRVRFVLEDAAQGDYDLYARLLAPSGLDDSFWVRVNGGAWYAWKSGIRQRSDFWWNRLPAGNVQLTAGTNTIDFAFREDGTGLDKIYLSQSGVAPRNMGSPATNCSPIDSPLYSGWQEAECAEVGSAWEIVKDAAALNQQYVVVIGKSTLPTPPADIAANRIRFTLDLDGVSDTTQLYLYARINAPSGDDDSFWVRFNNGQWYPWRSGIRQRTGFTWNRFPLALTNVQDGVNTLDFAYREDGTQLDRIYYSTMDELDLDEASTDSNCTSAAIASHAPLQPDRMVAPSQPAASTLTLYPNPARDHLTLNHLSEYTGRVEVTVFDINGRRVLGAVYEKEGGQLLTDLDIGHLPAGIYRLQLLEGDRHTVRPFVRQ